MTEETKTYWSLVHTAVPGLEVERGRTKPPILEQASIRLHNSIPGIKFTLCTHYEDFDSVLSIVYSFDINCNRKKISMRNIIRSLRVVIIPSSR